jgi:hypothetical protein
MVEFQLKGIFYNCDDKYFPGQKCKEHNLFMVMFEDVFEEEAYVSPMDVLPPPNDFIPPYDPPEVEPIISLNSLIAFSATQTLKLIGYIRIKKSPSSLTVETPIILFITALLKKSIVISV